MISRSTPAARCVLDVRVLTLRASCPLLLPPLSPLPDRHLHQPCIQGQPAPLVHARGGGGVPGPLVQRHIRGKAPPSTAASSLGSLPCFARRGNLRARERQRNPWVQPGASRDVLACRSGPPCSCLSFCWPLQPQQGPHRRGCPRQVLNPNPNPSGALLQGHQGLRRAGPRLGAREEVAAGVRPGGAARGPHLAGAAPPRRRPSLFSGPRARGGEAGCTPLPGAGVPLGPRPCAACQPASTACPAVPPGMALCRWWAWAAPPPGSCARCRRAPRWRWCTTSWLSTAAAAATPWPPLAGSSSSCSLSRATCTTRGRCGAASPPSRAGGWRAPPRGVEGSAGVGFDDKHSIRWQC